MITLTNRTIWRKSLYVSLSILSLFLGSCSDSLNKDIEVQELNKTVLDDAAVMKVDTVHFSKDFLCASAFLVYQDSALVVINGRKTSDYFIEIYNLKSKETIAQYFKKGKGHNELLSANADLNKNMLIVNDFVRAQFAFINMDSVLQDPNYRVSVRQHELRDCPTAIPYKGKFLVENPYCFTSKEMGVKQGLEYGEPRFIVTNGSDRWSDTDKYKYYTRNVAVDGRIIYNASKHRLLYANCHESRLEVYDDDLNLLKEVNGPVKLEAKYVLEPMDGNNKKEVVFCEYAPFAYQAYCTDEEDLYLVYLGQNLYPGKNSMEDMTAYVLQFDWEGNFKKCYTVGKFVINLTKGTDKNVFYATGYDANRNVCLLKLTANEK